jgi:hypothetical protein
VNEGSAFMESKQGVVEVPANAAVFQALSAQGLPQLLATIPGFFKPGSYEQQFLQRAQELRNAIPQKRLERIDFLKKQGLVPPAAKKALDRSSRSNLGKELLRWRR